MTRSIRARSLRAGETDEVLAFLREDARANLFLLDLVLRCGAPPAPGEVRSEIAVATRGSELLGVAALRPSIVFDAGIAPAALEAFYPMLEAIRVGLVKSPALGVDLLWSQLHRKGRRSLVDRHETAYALRCEEASLVGPTEGCRLRQACADDLEPLVFAARESLREEHRPDPFAGDVRGFRRWVRGRVPRARVLESAGRVVFVGYADVRLPEGWLLQGIYTWPDARRRGFASAGTSDLCRLGFETVTHHVQLSVVEGNEAARGLYEGLGFKPFGRLRTILFH